MNIGKPSPNGARDSKGHCGNCHVSTSTVPALQCNCRGCAVELQGLCSGTAGVVQWNCRGCAVELQGLWFCAQTGCGSFSFTCLDMRKEASSRVLTPLCWAYTQVFAKRKVNIPATPHSLWGLWLQMSRAMRKPAFCICKNKDADQLRGNREADQRLCFRYIDSTIPLLPKSKILSL